MIKRQKPRNWWKNMPDADFIAYGKKQGLYGLSPSKARQKDTTYYDQALKRGISDKIFQRKIRDLESLSDAQFIAYGKKQGLYGLSPSKVQQKDNSYYYQARKRGISGKLFQHKHVLASLSDAQLIVYGKKQGLYGLSPNEARPQDYAFYYQARKRGIVDKVFHRKYVLPSMSNKQFIAYGKKQGLIGLSPREIFEKNSNYYYQARKRGLSDQLFNRKIITSAVITRFLEQNKSARTIASLSMIDGLTSDAAQLLSRIWPERFPSLAQLVRSLPGAIRRIGHALQPFYLPQAKDLYEELPSIPKDVKRNLEDTLYLIMCDQYQKAFNQEPQKTINDIREFAQDSKVKKLASRVLQHYGRIYSFAIPGWGRVKNYAIQVKAP